MIHSKIVKKWFMTETKKKCATCEVYKEFHTHVSNGIWCLL